jgi:hypothetical protein
MKILTNFWRKSSPQYQKRMGMMMRRTRVLDGQHLTTWVKALRISSMYIQQKLAIHVPLLFKGTQTVEKALLDSGATENFLDRRTVARLKLPIKQLKDP